MFVCSVLYNCSRIIVMLTENEFCSHSASQELNKASHSDTVWPVVSSGLHQDLSLGGSDYLVPNITPKQDYSQSSMSPQQQVRWMLE